MNEATVMEVTKSKLVNGNDRINNFVSSVVDESSIVAVHSNVEHIE